MLNQIMITIQYGNISKQLECKIEEFIGVLISLTPSDVSHILLYTHNQFDTLQDFIRSKQRSGTVQENQIVVH